MKTQVGDGLTERQGAILGTIVGWIRKYKRAPTTRELMVFLGIKSPNGVSAHLMALQKKGVLERADGAISRGTRPSGMDCPHCQGSGIDPSVVGDLEDQPCPTG